MKINQATIDLVKKWEGFKPEAYLCPANKWTIGYGITAEAGIGVDPRPNMRVTQAEAEEHLRQALEKFSNEIRPAFTRQPNDNQFGAFLSLAYNVGSGGVRGSTAMRRFNAGDDANVPDAIRMWNRANGAVMRGLVNRREDEVRLFQTPVYSAPVLGELPGKPYNAPKPSNISALIGRLLAWFGGRA